MRKVLSASLLFLVFTALVLTAFFLAEKSESPTAEREKKTAAPAGVSARPGGPPTVTEAHPRRDRGRAAQPPSLLYKAAVIMDDLGNSLEAIRALRGLGQPVTAAILPFAAVTAETAREAGDGGLEIMLHLPLESVVPREPNAGRISDEMSPAEVRSRLEACLDQVPGCQGVNNHEGSKVTEDAILMPVILDVLKARELYFIDSRTSKDSIAYETAKRMGLRSAMRQVFLDEQADEDAIRARLEELFRTAREKGAAVGICHPKKETFAALKKYLGLAESYGVRLVFASEVVEK